MIRHEQDGNVVLEGSCLDILPTLEEGSCQTICTSPPYWSLREYGTGRWEGGDKSCDHLAPPCGGRHKGSKLDSTGNREGYSNDGQYKGTCKKCGAKRVDKQLGNEATAEEYVANMVEVFRQCRRVLRDDGMLVLNLGVTYGNGKQLIHIPWMTASALQKDGWIWRSDIPWLNRGKMPQSVRDRPSTALEYVMLFAKQSKYYWDGEAVKYSTLTNKTREREKNNGESTVDTKTRGIDSCCGVNVESGRNLRNSDLWLESVDSPHGLCGIDDELVGIDVCSEGSTLGHFALYPCSLIRPFIKACSAAKCCAECMTPYRRILEKERKVTRPGDNTKVANAREKLPSEEVGRNRGPSRFEKTTLGSITGNRDPQRHCTETRTIGWEPGCKCGCEDTAPSLVLDPFAGGLTTGVVCQQLGRKFLGIELNPEYIQMGLKRLQTRGRYGRVKVGKKKHRQPFLEDPS